MASNLIGLASNLMAFASNLAMASNLMEAIALCQVGGRMRLHRVSSTSEVRRPGRYASSRSLRIR